MVICKRAVVILENEWIDPGAVAASIVRAAIADAQDLREGVVGEEGDSPGSSGTKPATRCSPSTARESADKRSDSSSTAGNHLR